MNLRRQFYLTIAAIASLMGCAENSDPVENSQHRSSVSSDVDPAHRDQLPSTIASLFRDEPLHEPDDLQSPLGNCPRIDPGHFTDWTAPSRQFLAKRLRAFPKIGQLLAHLEGFYLINDLSQGVAGMTCMNNKTKRMVILLDAKRMQFFHSPGQKRQFQWGKDPLFLSLVDRDHYVLVHELFHALEFAYLRHKNGAPKEPLKRFFSLSWHPDGTGKFPAIPNHFSLTEAPKDLEVLATATNFVSPYGSKSPSEDWATTLTAYYLGAHHDEWMVVDVYDQLSPEGERLYRFETEKIVKDSGPHRQKVCLAAEIALEEDCRPHMKR